MTDTDRIVEYFRIHVDEDKDSLLSAYNSGCIRRWISFEDEHIIGTKMRSGISYFMIDILIFIVSIILDTKPIQIVDVAYVADKPIIFSTKVSYSIDTLGKASMVECLRICSEGFKDTDGFVKIFDKLKQYQADKIESVVKYIIDNNIVNNVTCKALLMHEYNKYEKSCDDMIL